MDLAVSAMFSNSLSFSTTGSHIQTSLPNFKEDSPSCSPKEFFSFKDFVPSYCYEPTVDITCGFYYDHHQKIVGSGIQFERDAR